MTAATTLARAGRVTPTGSRTTTPSSGGRSAPTAGRASPATFRSAREPPTPTLRGTGSTTATTPGCRSTAGSPIRPGRTTPTAPATTPTAHCTNWTSTPQQYPCPSRRPDRRRRAEKGGSNVEGHRNRQRGAGGRAGGPGRRGRQQPRLGIGWGVHQPGGELADDRGRLSGAVGADFPEPGHVPGRHLRLQPFRVVDRGQAGHREPGRQLEVLLRELLEVLRLLPRLLPHPGRHAAQRQPGAGL